MYVIIFLFYTKVTGQNYNTYKSLLWKGKVKFLKNLEILYIMRTPTEIGLGVIATNFQCMTLGGKSYIALYLTI